MNALDNPIYFKAETVTAGMTLAIQQKTSYGAKIVAVVPHLEAVNGVAVTKGMWVFFDK